jgi:hypothetical protein
MNPACLPPPLPLYRTAARLSLVLWLAVHLAQSGLSPLLSRSQKWLATEHAKPC